MNSYILPIILSRRQHHQQLSYRYIPYTISIEIIRSLEAHLAHVIETFMQPPAAIVAVTRKISPFIIFGNYMY